jgi:hypothetical protein
VIAISNSSVTGLGTDLAINAAIAVILSALGFTLARAVDFRQSRRASGHLVGLIPRRASVQIVLPEISVREFEIDGLNVKASPPSNVHWMPLPESLAVSTLIEAIHVSRPFATIEIVTSERVTFGPNKIVICVGGPAINSYTSHILASHLSDLNFVYPAHVVHFRGAEFSATFGEKGEVKEDCGFCLFTKLQETPCLLFFGVRAYGTQIAIRSFLTVSRQSSAWSRLRSLRSTVILSKGFVKDIQVTEFTITDVIGLE